MYKDRVTTSNVSPKALHVKMPSRSHPRLVALSFPSYILPNASCP